MTKKPETVKQEDLIKRKDGLYYVKDAQVPFTGTSEDFFENGQLRRRRNYKNGEYGLMEGFYDDGRLKERAIYKDGYAHGILELYDFDRRKKSNSKRLENKWNFKKGKMHGICESFYPEGDQIIFSRSTYQDGKRIEERTFHRNGLLESKTIGDYTNYTKESYDGNGKFTSKFMVKDGKYFYFKGGWKDKFRLWLWC